MKQYFVYILSNKNRTVLYIGFTDDVKRRIEQHKKGNGALFSKKYNVTELVYFETYEDISVAMRREKQLKNWHKDWKWNLIKKSNSDLKTIEFN